MVINKFYNIRPHLIVSVSIKRSYRSGSGINLIRCEEKVDFGRISSFNTVLNVELA